MKVLYFSAARMASGLASEEIPVADFVSADELWKILLGRHPDLAGVRRGSRLSRNGEYADGATVFSNPDEVAVIPPVSGG